MEYTVTINSSGQITLPKAVRTRLKLSFGDEVNLRLMQNRVELVRPKSLQDVLNEIDKETPSTVRAEIERCAKQITDALNKARPTEQLTTDSTTEQPSEQPIEEQSSSTTRTKQSTTPKKSSKVKEKKS